MNYLPPEVQLDIFKCLNFTQLLNVQQTNCYFKNFINEYEDELARKKCHKLLFVIFY
ncbi:unnamed protein product [Meloidogyne enterolobii]|uniref:Uncharacterized protein n=1 Tax=Meloidogyne enterolobii TaxID=390850 RepID=A0ACB0XUY2_MELEN